MTAAIFGLLGVVVGGVLNGVVGRWQVRRAESDELRAAARLLLGDFEDMIRYVVEVDFAMAVAEHQKNSPLFPSSISPSARRWDEFEMLFVRMLSFEEWTIVRNGAIALRDDEHSLSDGVDHRPVWAHARGTREQAHTTLREAIDIVSQLARHGRSPIQQLRRHRRRAIWRRHLRRVRGARATDRS